MSETIPFTMGFFQRQHLMAVLGFSRNGAFWQHMRSSCSQTSLLADFNFIFRQFEWILPKLSLLVLFSPPQIPLRVNNKLFALESCQSGGSETINLFSVLPLWLCFVVVDNSNNCHLDDSLAQHRFVWAETSNVSQPEAHFWFGNCRCIATHSLFLK